jgi:hypothetical protein
MLKEINFEDFQYRYRQQHRDMTIQMIKTANAPPSAMITMISVSIALLVS